MLAFHRFNFLLEPARGGRRTQSAVGINENGNSSGRRGTINLTDKAAIAHIRARGTNSNNIVGGGDVATGCLAQRNVPAASRVERKRSRTHGGVVAPSSVVFERRLAVSRVEAAGSVAQERFKAKGRVSNAVDVLQFLARRHPKGLTP